MARNRRRLGDNEDGLLDAIEQASQEFPVVLYSTGTVAIGKEATLDADDLQNHYDRDIQIEEVRFYFWLNSVASGALVGAGSFNTGEYMSNLAALVRVQLKMGRIDLTNGYVPAWLLGPKLQEAVEVSQGRTVAATNVSLWHYHKWKLPKPMLVPRGATLLPTFQYLLPDGTTTLLSAANSPITVHVALVGRSLSLDRLPQTIQVPYASAFIPTVVGIRQQQSQDDQLVNKFNVPLHVQRLIGRITQLNGSTRTEAWARNADLQLMAARGQITADQVNGNFGRLRITDSAGYLIVPYMTLWNDVFNPARASMEVGRILGPRGWYTVQLADRPSTAYLPMISMLGWREEELAP